MSNGKNLEELHKKIKSLLKEYNAKITCSALEFWDDGEGDKCYSDYEGENDLEVMVFLEFKDKSGWLQILSKKYKGNCDV